ncbi:MAG: 3-dehydroquinate synthase [Bacteriovoracaceae bacterium]|nr:3-dehydroquinate synthase [Bacteriovoracaceae bacterium]
MSSKHKFVEFNDLKSTIESIETDTLIIIIDLNLHNIYSRQLEISNIQGKRIILWKSPPGENCKTFEEYERCLEFIIEKGVHRNSHVLAIGGGATSDFAGFVATTILRGVKWSVVPTTFLSMIDASIGGKVGINSKFGKNLIGGFHQPENIFVCKKFLETLPEDEMQSGLGEMIKYCYLDPAIGEAVKSGISSLELIEDCMKYKQNIVKEDLKESGKRKLLNFGHTLGHALEKIYDLKHGIAVLWGMALIIKLYGTKELSTDLEKYCSKLGLLVEEPPWYNKTFRIDEIMEYLTKDKKTTNKSAIDLILCSKNSEIVIKSKDFLEIRNDLESNALELRTFKLY